MQYVFKAPKVFEKIIQIDNLCIPKNQKLTDKDMAIVDLSDIKFIKPLGIIGVLLLVEHIMKMKKDERPRIGIYPPKDTEVLDYLLQVSFDKALKSLGKWNIPKDVQASRRKIKPVIPITRFHNWQDIENIANTMQEKFHTDFIGLTTLLQPCHIVFSELAINAVEHANSDGGFVLAQKYDYQRGSILEIAVGDCGIGIAKSLKQKLSNKRLFKSDRQAIALVLDGGLSCVSDPHRGNGLYFVKEELTHAPDRSLTIRSGNGYAILSTGARPYSANCVYFPGTLAHAVIPCK
jgi:hypothetical protein